MEAPPNLACVKKERKWGEKEICVFPNSAGLAECCPSPPVDELLKQCFPKTMGFRTISENPTTKTSLKSFPLPPVWDLWQSRSS